MSGVPPTLGFISKELLYEAKLGLPVAHHLVAALGVLANSLGVAVALIVGVRPFLGTHGSAAVHHRPGWGMVMPPVLLAALGLSLGLIPGWLDKVWISPAVTALGMDPKLAKLTLWHGFTPVLAMSVFTLIFGVCIFVNRGKLGFAGRAIERIHIFTPTALYQAGLDGILKLGALLTGWIQQGQLRTYVRVTLVAASGLIFYAMAHSVGKFPLTSRVPLGFFETAVVLLMSVSAIAAVRAKSRLAAILSLGGVGYSVAFLFAAYGAPDLAITQLLVETLTVVLFSFVILKLPKMRDISRKDTRRRDGLVATLAGLAMTWVVWKSVHVQVHEPISPGLVERSATEAFGRNVVNVILVDFRALDTLGEILVLSLACLGVTALLFRKRKLRETADELSERAAARGNQSPS
jgi:multicomponent Na+:H+ antiporter subunit A